MNGQVRKRIACHIFHRLLGPDEAVTGIGFVFHSETKQDAVFLYLAHVRSIPISISGSSAMPIPMG